MKQEGTIHLNWLKHDECSSQYGMIIVVGGRLRISTNTDENNLNYYKCDSRDFRATIQMQRAVRMCETNNSPLEELNIEIKAQKNVSQL